MKLYNSLSKTVEDFVPLRSGRVDIYACGPTVYDFTHIGHGRKYTNDDVLRRTLSWLGFQVKHVQNITDVGHLVSDGDEGEDKMEKGAKKSGMTVMELANFYTDYFFKAMDSLNILRPDISCKATEHIREQVELIKKIIDRGYAYDAPEAVYFDTQAFEGYANLFGQAAEERLVGARDEVVTDTNKKNPSDFVLWFKRVGKYEDHILHWESPWGDGFPGWHIECSAMSMKYLGEQFDIHTGGEDHVSIHHPNEIAQSEAATGKHPFVKYWFHSVFLMVDGRKMGKSLGNFVKLTDISDKGFEPMALRYLFLSTHYRRVMNFTWESLDAAQTALRKARNLLDGLGQGGEVGEWGRRYLDRFKETLEDDLNTPRALAVLWEALKSELAPAEKRAVVMEMDKVLGLNLFEKQIENLSDEVLELAERRKAARLRRDWVETDRIRDELYSMGIEVRDTASGQVLEKVK